MEYFTTFPSFTIKDGEALRNAFKRLAKLNNWEEARRSSERTKFHKLVIKEMNTKYDKLEHLQGLCENLFPDKPTPTSITQCTKLLKTKYVNIWDIVDGKFRYFDDYKTFRNYTRNGRTFRKEAAKGLMLNVFLRHL
ncbi:hypothetical protein BGX31_005723 [Mortierella sp. GBA43]|nr:hypothetical protein BGX31_005723 [Mortierella sp. GBA43]